MIDFFACLPGHFFGDGNILREGPIAIHAQYLHIAADMRLTRPALITVPAGNMGLGSDKIPWDNLRHLTPNLDHLSRELMPKDTRHLHAILSPGIPIVDMHVSSADRGRFDLHQYIARPNPRYINQSNRCSRRCLSLEGRLHLSFHCNPPTISPGRMFLFHTPLYRRNHPP